MRTAFILLITLSLFACSDQSGKEKSPSGKVKIATLADFPKTPDGQSKSIPATEPIISERIDGPANVRDAINGELLFTLNDKVLISCAPLEKDWYRIGLMMEVDPSEAKSRKLKKGRKIIVDGQEAGEIKTDMAISTWADNETAWAELIGYTHKDNIQAASVIENVLPEYLQRENSRSAVNLQGFIEQFKLEKADQFEGYTIYYNYESWIEDPSPMWRIGLVLQEGRLVSILHSRPLKIEETANYKLDRAFHCLVYNDVEKPEEIAEMFNDFVNSVD